jgi:hypothetical protein
MADPLPPIAEVAEQLREASRLLWHPSPADMEACRAAFTKALERARACRQELRAAGTRDPAMLGMARVLETEIALCAYVLEKTIAIQGELIGPVTN